MESDPWSPSENGCVVLTAAIERIHEKSSITKSTAFPRSRLRTARSAKGKSREWPTGRPSRKLWTRNELTRMKPKVSVTNVMNVRADRLSAQSAPSIGCDKCR